MAGINIKLWNIKGGSGNGGGKGCKANLSDSITYISNPEKIDGKLSEESSQEFNQKQIYRECKYIENDIKTFEGAFVGSHNLPSTDIKQCVNDFMKVKNFYDKTDGRAALHGVISLPEDESNMENASKLLGLCNDFLKEVFPDHQAVFAVHTNTDNLHCHFILNSVGINGKKIHQPKNFVKDTVQPVLNKLAEKYGITPNDEWKKSKKVNITDYVMLKKNIRTCVDKAIENSNNFDDFKSNMEEMGFNVNVGKYISLKNADMNKALRTHQLGNNYTLENIVKRIQTRKMAFEKDTGNIEILPRDKVDKYIPVITVLKKYKDMSINEKEYIKKQIKLGNNPWRKNKDNNWQINNISSDINVIYRIKHYIQFYSKDGSLESAMDGVVEKKKEIAAEKKRIRDLTKEYKPIFDIYKEMKKIQRKAYLYEFEDCKEYRDEYEQYRELTRRLKKGYNKSFEDVENITNFYDEQILFLNYQLKELSLEYGDLKKYGLSKGVGGIVKGSISEYLDLSNIYKTGDVFSNDVFYLASTNNPDFYLRVEKTPEINSYGKMSNNITVSLMNKYGEVVEKCDFMSDRKVFYEFVGRMERTYNFKNCESFKNVGLVNEYCLKNRKTVENVGGISFSEAINSVGVNNSDKEVFVCNNNSPTFFASASKQNEEIALKILDRNGKFVEEKKIPSYSKKNKGGYDSLVKIQDKYQFSDDCVVFDSLEEARSNRFAADNKRVK